MIEPRAKPRPDVAIIGVGVIGLSVALEVSRRGASVALIGEALPGEASPAAAGMLAPSVEELASPARRFGLEARDRYPLFLERLKDQTGIDVPLDRRGILEVTREPDRARAMLERADSGAAEWVEPGRLGTMEGSLARAEGALFHERDGSVDNVILMRALERAVGQTESIRRVRGLAQRVDRGATVARIEQIDGTLVECEQVVLASGAWAGQIAGLPRPLPVRPLRGQMLSLGAAPLSRVVYGDSGYLVPRGSDRTLVGATMEEAGFDPSTTEAATIALRAAAASICPTLKRAAELDSWAGLRPATPDLLPILGRDPLAPSLIYACGHSRNGILMAPLTAQCIAAIVVGEAPDCALDAFAVDRFDS